MAAGIVDCTGLTNGSGQGLPGWRELIDTAGSSFGAPAAGIFVVAFVVVVGGVFVVVAGVVREIAGLV